MIEAIKRVLKALKIGFQILVGLLFLHSNWDEGMVRMLVISIGGAEIIYKTLLWIIQGYEESRKPKEESI